LPGATVALRPIIDSIRASRLSIVRLSESSEERPHRAGLNEIAIRSFSLPLRVVGTGACRPTPGRCTSVSLSGCLRDRRRRKARLQTGKNKIQGNPGLLLLHAHILRNVVNNPLTKVTFLAANLADIPRLDDT
jgi:hypothetical protein